MSKDFKRPESWKYKRLTDKWRKPRGAKNPARRGVAGRPALPEAGRRGRADQRGLHPSGLREVRVFRLEELEGLGKDAHIVRIAGSVGKKKRMDIFARAKKMGLKVVQNEPKSTKKDSK